MRVFLISLFIVFTFISCSHKNLDGSNDLHSLISTLVEESSDKIQSTLHRNDVILVSDFVNLDQLKNRTQLGFLLSNLLKERLSSLGIIIREVEFSKEFTLGENGLNLLSRDVKRILSLDINAKFAVVGTYSVTSKNLNVFIKLIDMETGYIHASSHESVGIDKEIIQMEEEGEERVQRFRPQMRL